MYSAVNFFFVRQATSITECKQHFTYCGRKFLDCLLQCEEQPEILNVTWWRTHENDNKTISSGKILHVNLATRRDSAKYVCEAENIKGRGMAYTDIMVMYAPDINIQYENYTHVSKDRKLKCLPKGFPDMYTFYSWEHTSDYGDHIRFLSGTTDGRLLLPEITDSSKQYQDNGFYLCTATNGIADSTGQTNRSASVYLSITGIPVFVAENTNVVYGVVNEPAEITVSIFSNPKYSDVIIKNKDGNRLLSNGIGMKLREQHMFVTDVIHTSRVRVKCYRTTFIITTLRSDMVQNYTVFVLNDYGNNRFQTSVLFANENAGFSFYIILSGSASLILAFIIVFTAYGIRRCLRRKIQINHSSTQTYKIEASQYDEIDENQIIHVHDVETAASDEIHVTDIDSDYEQPDNSVIRQRSNSDQRNLPSGSSSESSENDIDENDTFTKDLILISYKQLTGDRPLPLPYDTLETVVN
ncbi:DSCAM [Mytilus edulis]|uniref:DSCAM n=1 Tax=Mytilus edulis TaxID=6550 RepID=A0A8S3SCC2_MYTED|nr:DSCAM [Mytilus edulis]